MTNIMNAKKALLQWFICFLTKSPLELLCEQINVIFIQEPELTSCENQRLSD